MTRAMPGPIAAILGSRRRLSIELCERDVEPDAMARGTLVAIHLLRRCAA